MSFTYIASPYSHEDPTVRKKRFYDVSLYTAHLIRSGVVAYSPIAHSHPLAEEFNLEGDFDAWKRQNFGMLSKASMMIVVCLDGWQESKGVTAEIAFARECGIPINYVSNWCNGSDGAA